MYSLYLYDTAIHDDIYTKNELKTLLKNINLLKNNNGIFTPADQFMNLITFLGCSPNIKLESKTFILTQVNTQLTAYGGDSIENIVCPKCKTKITNPFELISNFSEQKIWKSNCCHNTIEVQKINWRKSAAFSQAFIQINNIFPKEAIPSDQLLKQLSEFSQSSWNYFYSKQQSF